MTTTCLWAYQTGCPDSVPVARGVPDRQKVHLRLCLACGHVGCCDSSIGKHATKHFHRTKHPVMRSLEPGESWAWCYADNVGFELAEPAPPLPR
jgi:hypothetical protein